jgi:protein TonB
MSTTLPPFLAGLGVVEGQAVDERGLRRAYALRLKQIDVEKEPDRFQALRESLDQALLWVAWRDRTRASAAEHADAAEPPGSPDRSPPSGSQAAQPVATPAPTLPNAEELGIAVFAEFHRKTGAGLGSEFDAREALAFALADDRLLNVDAKTFFEWHVARVLANGWQAGHEHLLGPAVELFGWERDHARLAHFGQVGALLSAAIRDRVVFFQLPEPQGIVLQRLIARLRIETSPDPGRLQEEVPQLQFLVQRVPNWLRIVSPVAPVNKRFEMWRQMPATPDAAAAPRFVPVPPPKALRRNGTPMFGTLVTMGVLIAVLRLVGDPSDTGRKASPPAVHALPDDAADADLERRQKQAEALLADVAAAHPAAPAVRPRADTVAQMPPSSSPDIHERWWAPAWARQSDSTALDAATLPDLTPRP